MLKVAYLDLFWSNGSYEVPITHPDPKTFTEKPNANRYMTTKEGGTVVLEGEWNYAYDTELDSYYFLDRIISQDIPKDHHEYTIIRDLSYELKKCKDLVIVGELNRVTDRKIIKENVHLCHKTLDNPLEVELIDIPTDIGESKITIKRSDKTFPASQCVVSSRAWENFVDEYRSIEDKSSTKPDEAVLAHLPRAATINYKYKAKRLLDEWCDDFEANQKDYRLVHIEREAYRFNGKYQLIRPTPENRPIGVSTSPLESLQEIDLSGLTDIIPVDPIDMTIYLNKPIGTFDIAITGLARRGWYQGTEFRETPTPWLRKDSSVPITEAPYQKCDFGVDEKMRMIKFTDYKSKDDVKVLYVRSKLNTDDLKKAESVLREIDRLIADKKSIQEGFLTKRFEDTGLFKMTDANKIPSYYAGCEYDPLEVGASPIISLFKGCKNKRSISTRYWLTTEGLPKKIDGTYNYEEISNMFNTNLDTFQIKHSAGLDYDYFIVLGNKIIAFYNEGEREPLWRKLNSIKHRVSEPSPENNKTEILSVFYKELGIINDGVNMSFIDENDWKNREIYFKLEGTNFFLYSSRGKTSLIIDEISHITKPSDYKVYNLDKDLDENQVIREINSSRALNIYGKEYPLSDVSNSIKNLKVTKFRPTTKLDTFETIHINYKSNNTAIFDVARIAREAVLTSRSAINVIEYENFLVDSQRRLEDFQLDKEKLWLTRDNEDNNRMYEWAQFHSSYGDMMTNAALGFAQTGVSVLAGGLTPLTGLAGVGRGIAIGSQITSFLQQKWAMELKKEQMQTYDTDQLKARMYENYRLDIQHKRLELDNKRAIRQMFNQYNVTAVNDRDIFNQLKELWKVGDVFLKKAVPDAIQTNRLEAHISQYGVECEIPNYELKWEEWSDKTNVWGFKYITYLNIKDPVLRIYTIGKFINGVKLIRPTYN